MLKLKPRRGRPKKFGRSARSVTLTLPEDILARLAGMDTDLGRAIVSLVEKAPRRREVVTSRASMATYGNHAVILVPQLPVLRRLPGIQLVPVGNGRALIALEHPHAVPQLELDLRDTLERANLRASERTVLEEIAQILRTARQSDALAVAERSIIVLEGRRKRSH